MRRNIRTSKVKKSKQKTCDKEKVNKGREKRKRKGKTATAGGSKDGWEGQGHWWPIRSTD